MIIMTMKIIVLIDKYALRDYFDLGNLDTNKTFVCTIMIIMVMTRKNDTILFLLKSRC